MNTREDRFRGFLRLKKYPAADRVLIKIMGSVIVYQAVLRFSVGIR